MTHSTRRSAAQNLPIPEPSLDRRHHLRRQGSGHQVPPDRADPALPDGAPNVLIVLHRRRRLRGELRRLVGRATPPISSGSPPNGLKYTRFHTTALCSPTRAALLAGRNHHSVGMGGITEIATSAPGYNSLRPKSKAPAAEILKLNGYATAHFGKCHEVPVWETSPMGPFDRWPSPGNGFEHFYGFIGGETNQYAPAIYQDTVPVEPDRTPEEGYHFTEDMTDHAIEWIRQQKALMPDKPFFIYYAPGPPMRHITCPRNGARSTRANSMTDGTPNGSAPSPGRRNWESFLKTPSSPTRPDEIPGWDDMDDDLKPVLARQMEVYAGFLEHTDHHVGRLLDALEDIEILGDTLIYVIIGDNGASAEGTPRGTFNELMVLNGVPQSGDHRVHGLQNRQMGHSGGLQPLCGWLGSRNGHAVPMDQAGRLALGRDTERDDRPLAEWHRGQGRVAPPIPPRDRRGPHHPRSCGNPGSDVRQRHPAGASRRVRNELLLRRCRGPRTPTRPSTSRCSSIEGSTTTAGRR